MGVELTLYVVLTGIEAWAIKSLAEPEEGWWKALGAASTANYLAIVVLTVAKEILKAQWEAYVVAPVGLSGAESLGIWFSAFTLSNAAELATLKWGWRVGLTKWLGLAIGATNAVSASWEVGKLLDID